MLFWLPSHLLSRLAMEYLSTNIRSARWSHIIDTILAPYLAGPVLLESIGIHRKQFQVTDKNRRREKTASGRYLIPHGILILLTAAAILRFAKGKYGMALFYSSVILYWLGYNLVPAVVRRILYAGTGVQADLGSDRGKGGDADNLGRGDPYPAVTEDVSEEGIALRPAGPGWEKEEPGGRKRRAGSGPDPSKRGCF